MSGSFRMYEDEHPNACGTICLKYVLLVFNFIFWLTGAGVMAVGVWTLVEKGDYLSLLASSTFATTAYILILAGSVVMLTGLLGCCAVVRERRGCLAAYCGLLLLIFLLEVIAGILAYLYRQQLSEELKSHMNKTIVESYGQPDQQRVTDAMDKLQQEFKCCGSHDWNDWQRSDWVKVAAAEGRLVPDSCCKSPTTHCGRRDHPSNINRVEGGCITKLEVILQEHLLLIGAVGIGVACLQVLGMILTCCLYRSIKLDPYY
ncbi:CD151 antigen-like isoform X1 [Lampetra fluviatilis]